MGTADLVAQAVKQAGVAANVAAGWARWTGERWLTEVGGEAGRLFDLASLTKPMTALSVATLPTLHRQRLNTWVPEVVGTHAAELPIEWLLAHRTGLADNLPLFLPLVRAGTVDRAEALRAAADARRSDVGTSPNHDASTPDSPYAPLYSDLGYILAGEALSRTLGLSDAGEAIDRIIVGGLGLQGTLGSVRALERAGARIHDCAPTEDVAWRGGVVRGIVHDENAFALTGLGSSGHAGMFGTVEAVLAFAMAVFDGTQRRGTFGGVDLDWCIRRRPGGTLRAGFDGKSPEGSSAGTRFGPDSYGHLGFTGTSFWIDPDVATVGVLLTNRVHPSRDNATIRAARPMANDLLHEAAQRSLSFRNRW
jgi:CubicO group peptidase (beta-lactamase class C family)